MQLVGRFADDAAFCPPTKGGPADVSPKVSWSAGPEGTRSYVLTMTDPDVPKDMSLINKPGATIEDTLDQVTTRIETKLEELDELDYTRSVTTPGQAIVYLELDPTTPAANVPAVWQHVRNMMSDIRPEFPQEFQGFQFNDDFGDVFGNIYAFTADGFTRRELRDRVEDIRKQVQALPMAGKTALIGVQKEQIHLEFSSARLAALGVNQIQVLQTLAVQNAIAPSGTIQAGPEQVLVRVGGQFLDAAAIAAVNLRVGDRFFNIGDVATVRRGYEDPPSSLFRFDGKDAIGLQIGMRDGGNILEFGKQLDALMEGVTRDLPLGIEMRFDLAKNSSINLAPFPCRYQASIWREFMPKGIEVSMQYTGFLP